MKEKNARIESAKETIQIIEAGHYSLDNKKVDISEKVKFSNENSVLLTPERLANINDEVSSTLDKISENTIIEVVNCTTMEALNTLSKSGRVACLNFASAKNPGGGFLNGAQAQEESLARASALYPTLMKNFDMYEYNKSRSTYLYSDYMIYSPNVVFIKNDDDELLEIPYQANILTSPAVNVGAIKNNRPSEMNMVEATMRNRIEKILSVFVYYKCEYIVLGAWGCGVFRNDPEQVAAWFNEYLGKGKKFGEAFKKIVFAVLSRSKDQQKIEAFEKCFK